MVCGGRDLKYHPVPTPAMGRGSSLFVYSEKGPLKRCGWRKPWLSDSCFITAGVWIENSELIIKPRYWKAPIRGEHELHEIALNFCPLSRKAPAQSGEHEMILQEQLLILPTHEGSVASLHLWYLYLRPGFVYLHSPSMGENLLPTFFELVPISTAHTSSFPSMETIPVSHPASKQEESLSGHTDCSRGCKETPHNDMWQCRWQGKRDQFTQPLQKAAVT